MTVEFDASMLRAGQRYVRRNGSVTSPLVKHAEEANWLSDVETGWDYDPTDEYGHHVFGEGSEYPYDIVAVYADA